MADRILRLGVVLAVVGVVFQSAVHLFNYFALDERYASLDVSAEHTAFAWVSTAASFAAACGALLLALRRERDRPLLLLAAALIAYFSMDDFVEIHERVGYELAQRIDLSESVAQRFWLLVFAPLFFAALWILWRIARATPGEPGRYQKLALGLLVAGVVAEGAGILTKRLEEDGNGTPHSIRALFEEGFELSGWVILAAAFFAAFYDTYDRGRT
jgi:hypothetical protein